MFTSFILLLLKIEERPESQTRSVEKKVPENRTKKKEQSPATPQTKDDKPSENRDPFKEILTGLEGIQNTIILHTCNIVTIYYILICRSCISKSSTM